MPIHFLTPHYVKLSVNDDPAYVWRKPKGISASNIMSEIEAKCYEHYADAEKKKAYAEAAQKVFTNYYKKTEFAYKDGPFAIISKIRQFFTGQEKLDAIYTTRRELREACEKIISLSRVNSEVIVFCGNPGAGKSTLCNSIFGEAKFESGISIGTGLTTHKQEHTYKNKLYIDTPGLGDVKISEQAAQEIEKALKHNNNYKLIFVAQLDSGRIRAADLCTINTVCDAIESDFEYGIIFNQISKKVLKEFKQSGLSSAEELCAYLSELGLHKKPSQVMMLTRDEQIEGEDNKHFEKKSENRKKLLNFIDRLNAKKIDKNKVKNLNTLDAKDYKHMLEEIEEIYNKKIAELDEILKRKEK